jgi:hypothetical protein
VRLRRNPVQAAFATGNVLVESGSELTLELHDVPSAKLVAALLNELTEHTPPPSRLPAFPGSQPGFPGSFPGPFGGGPPLG